jgi:hypothetical protein
MPSWPHLLLGILALTAILAEPSNSIEVSSPGEQCQWSAAFHDEPTPHESRGKQGSIIDISVGLQASTVEFGSNAGYAY